MNDIIIDMPTEVDPQTVIDTAWNDQIRSGRTRETILIEGENGALVPKPNSRKHELNERQSIQVDIQQVEEIPLDNQSQVYMLNA